MQIGSKIKQLRGKANMTQEHLAEKLGISAQSVSKWETGAAMPDITLLPLLAEQFGVTIDELFDLTKEQKLHRIDKRMDLESELPTDVFCDYEAFLREELASGADRARISSLLAQLYHHRMEADARRVSRYARDAMRLTPEKKECQWLLSKAEGAVVWDWNIGNHAKVIDFYKELIENDTVTPPTPLPYYYLLDNLLADNRLSEAEQYLAKLEKVPAHRPLLVAVYRAYIALGAHDEQKADEIMQDALAEFAQDGSMLFEAAQYYARKCDYDRAIQYYEASYASEQQQLPRYTDALEGIARIYEIMGDCGKAAATYDRILDSIRNEWGYGEEDAAVQETLKEKERLLQKQARLSNTVSHLKS